MEESVGAVLGANVMQDHNIVFDYDNRRVGFAEGVCDYKPNSKTDAGEEVCFRSMVYAVRFGMLRFRDVVFTSSCLCSSERTTKSGMLDKKQRRISPLFCLPLPPTTREVNSLMTSACMILSTP